MYQKTVLLFLCLTYALSTACNAGAFWMWNRPNILQITASTAYLAAWAWALYRYRNSPRWLGFSHIVGILGMTAALFALLSQAGLHTLLMLPALLLSGLFLTPLYGISVLLRNSTPFYLAAELLRFSLLAISLYLQKCRNKHTQ